MAAKKHISVVEANKALPELTAKKFEIVEFTKRSSLRFVGPFGEVDINTLSIARATQLVHQKAPFIQLKKSGK